MYNFNVYTLHGVNGQEINNSKGTVCIISICTLYMVYMGRKYITVKGLFVYLKYPSIWQVQCLIHIVSLKAFYDQDRMRYQRYLLNKLVIFNFSSCLQWRAGFLL